jgi:hypothetical protein
MDLIHTMYEDVDQVQLAQDRIQWHTLVDTVRNFEITSLQMRYS